MSKKSLTAPAGFQSRKSGLLVPSSFSQTYEGARVTRHRKWLPTVTKDSREVLTPSVLRILRSSARQIFTNSGIVRGAFLDVARYLVGFNGIIPQSMAEDRGWAAEMELRWLNWLKIADVRRKLHFNQILRSASVEMDTDGDFGLVLTQTGGGDMESPGMAQIQTVRGHRIDDDPEKEGSNAGVIEDAIGRVRAYRIKQGDTTRDIPAQSFILMGDPELSDWSRYPSAIAHGINTIQDSREIMGFVFDGIKNRTSRAFFRKTPTGEVDEDDLLSDDDAPAGDDELTLEEIQGGEIPRMGPGEEIVELTADYPGGMVMPTLEFNFRDFACGYGTPLEVIWESKAGAQAQRFFLSKFQRRVDERRGFVFVPHLLTRLWGFFVSCEIKRKAMPFRPDWWKHRYVTTSPKVTVDVGREARENREDILLGSRSLEEDAGERGIDWEELRDQLERENADLIDRAKRLAQEKDIEFTLALSLMSRRTPNGNLPQGPQTAEPTTPLKD